MRRRNFVRNAGAASLVPMLAACARTAGITIEEMVAPGGGATSPRDPDGVWTEGLAYARWTPSPHNTQPWRLRVVSPAEAEVYYDPRRLLPVEDADGAFTTATLSMFVDYLSIAVRPRGFDVVADISQDPIDFSARTPVRWATLALVPAREAEAFDRRLILQRKTSRLPYDGHPVGGETMAAIAAIAHEYGSEMACSSDGGFAHWVIELNRAALLHDLNNRPVRSELGQWIRTTDEEAASRQDGLWSRCMRMPGWLMRAFFDDHDRWAHGWRAAISGQMLENSMRGSRTMAWWSGPFDRPTAWIAAGRMLGRTWLELTRRGVYVHPYGSLITNREAHPRLVQKVGASERGGQLWFIARLGRSETPPRSYRVPAASILLGQADAT